MPLSSPAIQFAREIVGRSGVVIGGGLSCEMGNEEGGGCCDASTALLE